ncbi:MAG: aminotransferase class III-fold pyridoxal phosphate-dependent enzyme, partial [Acidimicrobiia bacterium]
AAALANINYVIDNDLQTNTLKVGNHLKSRLDHLADDPDSIVGDVRGKGLQIGVEFVKPGTRDPDPEITMQIMEGARERGLLIGKGGLYANVLRIAPPLSLTEDEADEGFEKLEQAIDEATGRSGPPRK